MFSLLLLSPLVKAGTRGKNKKAYEKIWEMGNAVAKGNELGGVYTARSKA
jgi:hypothetical protein